MFMSSRDNITSLMFDVSSVIIDIRTSLFQRSNMVSLMFDISPIKKCEVFYGQEPRSGESTTTEYGVNYQLLAVMF